MVASLPMYLSVATIMFFARSAVADMGTNKAQHASSLMRVHDVQLKPRIALDQRAAHMMRLDQSIGDRGPNGTSGIRSSVSLPWSSASAAVAGDGEAVLLTLPRIEQRSKARTADPFVPVSEAPVDVPFLEPIKQPQIGECPPPAAYRRGWFIAGLFFVVMALVCFQREAWWRCTEHADARGTLDFWCNGHWSTPAGTIFAMLAFSEVALHMYGLHMYGQTLSVQGLVEARNAITFSLLSLAAWLDPVIRRHHPIQANRILCCILALTLVLVVFWLGNHSPEHLVALDRMFTFLKLTAFINALFLCLQAIIPSSNLRCAVCFFFMLHGAFYVDIAGHWFWEEGSGCSQIDDQQYKAANLHGKVIAASVTAWFGTALSLSYVWAVHVQYAMRAECKALMSAANPRNHE